MEPREQTKNKTALHYALTLRLYGDEKCFGPGIAALLHGVEKTQSLRQAAIEMDMAYSKAWRVLKTAEASLGFPLLSSTTGGKGGGGAELTPAAKDLLARYEGFSDAVKGYADEVFLDYFG